MGGLFVCFSETAFNGMQTPAARLGSRPKRWLMCDWQRVLTQIQPGKEMQDSSSINTQPMSIWAHKRFGNLKQRKVNDLSAYITGGHIGYAVQVSPEHRLQTACQSSLSVSHSEMLAQATFREIPRTAELWVPAMKTLDRREEWYRSRKAVRSVQCDAMFGPRAF